MTYTERKTEGGSTYYYRTLSVRDNGSVKKKRVYLGKDLDGDTLIKKEKEADKELIILEGLLTEDEVLRLDQVRERYQNTPETTEKNRYEAFISRFTHDSTAIEGNTLTLQETAGLLFDHITPSSKDLREVHEVINHKEAFDFILSYGGDISRDLVLKLHEMVVRNTLDSTLEGQIGRFRELQVFIRGVEWMPPSPEEVPGDMKELFRWYTLNKDKVHPLVLSSYFHVGFETVHPFVDGNGRVGRLLMNFILHKKGFPMVNIPSSRKMEYYGFLEKAQVHGDLRSFVKFIFDLMTGSGLLF